jgi:hypothetical protein
MVRAALAAGETAPKPALQLIQRESGIMPERSAGNPPDLRGWISNKSPSIKYYMDFIKLISNFHLKIPNQSPHMAKYIARFLNFCMTRLSFPDS